MSAKCHIDAPEKLKNVLESLRAPRQVAATPTLVRGSSNPSVEGRLAEVPLVERLKWWRRAGDLKADRISRIIRLARADDIETVANVKVRKEDCAEFQVTANSADRKT